MQDPRKTGLVLRGKDVIILAEYKSKRMRTASGGKMQGKGARQGDCQSEA